MYKNVKRSHPIIDITKGVNGMSKETCREPDEAYIQSFLSFSNRFESRLLRMIVVLLVLLAVFQGLLQIDEVRGRLSVIDRLEGSTLHFAP